MSTSQNNKCSDIGFVIMASGLGVRFGGNKLMADFGGKPMVASIIDTATDCFEKVVVVTRNQGVVDYCNNHDTRVVFHSLPHRSDTIRLGIENTDSNVSGIIFCPADQPFLSEDTLIKIIEAAGKEPDRIWRLSHNGQIAAPNFFPRRFFDELSNLPEGKGGSVVCKAHEEVCSLIEIDDELEITDIDTQETYNKLKTIRRN